ncbi:hypothetical protein [Halorussus pelagicus]|uniref:hypothetical protein n=1 Tax=Halorussus pelagicus TaxID=2505977 RepID=UPI000FFC2CC2|nr:hypothetical protein [Halorussus pelagicus]
MSSESNRDDSINRRNILKGVAGGAMASFAASSSAVAEEGISQTEVERATAGYREIGAVQQAFDEQSDLLADVAEAGLIEEASVDALGLTELREPAPEYDGEGVTYGAKTVDGRLTPEVRFFRNLEEGVLTVAVLPEVEDGYAVLNPHEEDGPVEIQSVDGEASCGDCANNKCCQECGYECCNCCGCEPCDQCMSCTCGMCYTCVDCQCCECGLNCAGECV